MSDVNNLIKETMNEIYDNNYSILVPKKIKLSKLLENLNAREDNDFEITRNDDMHLISLDNENCLREYINIEHRHIVDISYDMETKEYKWIFLLWVANTEIIDDLKEDKQ